MAVKPPKPPPESKPGPELNDEQTARKAVLLSAFRTFARESGMLPDYESQPHDEMCDELEACMPEIGTGGEQKKQIYLAPRYTYKTSLLVAFMVYCILWYRERGVDISIDYIRAQATLASEVLFELKMALQTNETIVELWGDFSKTANIWKENAISLSTRRDFTISTSGLDYGGAGKHPDLVIFDDIVNEKNFDSIKAKRAARVKIQAYYPILPPWGSMIDTGTRFGPTDVHGWLLEQNARDAKEHARLVDEGDYESAKLVKPQWKEYIRSVRDRAGNLFFPAKLTEKFLAQQRRSIEAKFYAAWYENRPDVEGMVRFRLEYLSYFSANYSRWPIPMLEIVDDRGGHPVTVDQFPVRLTMTIDPTVTANATSDWTGYSIVADDANDDWWVLELGRMLEVPSVVGERCVEMILKYVPAVVEIESAQADVEMVARIQKAIVDHHLPTVIRSYSVLRDEKAATGRRKKSARIEALEPRFRNGKIRLHRGRCEAFYDQYRNWPDLEHDDVFDALAMQYRVAKPCAYATMNDAAVEILDQDDEEPGDIFSAYRSPVGATRYLGRAGLSSQRLTGS